MAECIGFRMRIPKLHSRFGNPLDDFENFQRIVGCVRKLKGRAQLGFHFHMPSWAIGVQRWMDGLHSLLLWCRTVEELTGVPVKRLDLGGGFFPADLERLDLSRIQDAVREMIPQVDAIYFEPGRSLTQDTEVLICRVLDVRRKSDGEVLEVVIDGCIAEMPLVGAFSHKMFYQPRSESGAHGRCELLTKGRVRVLGRICMEDDILSGGVNLPDSVQVGDFVIIGDAGGYERTMSYDFGRG
jgi:diaminopimelate decarboxylase